MRLSQSLEPLKAQVVRKVYLRKRLWRSHMIYSRLTKTKVNAALKACTDLKLDGLVILGCNLTSLFISLAK
ncbi:unnamed protein product [Eruca vesicaria subsp. sativa]|uniref:Uncharacterized protein n=1 Tax=Eruca vesicaria subsp. sativa TaxID=29727 RepID=A0ABC8IQC6_ERUVS|nr:unnamed protein product [Eruca vesicaria subsp. sativa]